MGGRVEHFLSGAGLSAFRALSFNFLLARRLVLQVEKWAGRG